MKLQKTYLESKYQDNLWYNEQPLGKYEYFEHDFGSYGLEGRILYNKTHDEPWVLSIHGARADLSKADAISFGLQKRGISLINFTMSGHSDASPVPLESTSLANNINEADAFFSYLTKKRPATIIGYSLGGNVALELLRHHSSKIDSIILFSPALYAKESYNKNFGAPFRSVISRPFSFMDNDILQALDKFQGKLLVVKGKYDGLEAKVPGTSVGTVKINGRELYSPIPKEVFEVIMDAHIPKTRKKLMEVPDADHGLSTYFRNNHSEQTVNLLNEIADFIKNSQTPD